MTETKKLTTAELFARVRKTLTDETICPEDRAWRSLAELESRLRALETRDAATREACDLIQSAAERLRREGADASPVDADALRSAEARGFDRARERAASMATFAADAASERRERAKTAPTDAMQRTAYRTAEAQWDVLAPLSDDIRAMKDETP